MVGAISNYTGLLAEKGSEELVTTTTTGANDGGWILDLSKGILIANIISKCVDVIYKDKIKKALGTTHYAKKGKLFRK